MPDNSICPVNYSGLTQPMPDSSKSNEPMQIGSFRVPDNPLYKKGNRVSLSPSSSYSRGRFGWGFYINFSILYIYSTLLNFLCSLRL